MAVDIKQLRIGAHVEVDGVLRAVFGLGCGRVSFLSHPTSSVALSVLATEVNPIPITPELLVELGFEEEQGSYYILTLPNEATIFAESLDDVLGNWHIQTFATKLYKRGDVFVRHLHELEAFTFLTLGKELIEE